MTRTDEALERVFDAFALLGELQRSFEATETKHKLRRASFEATPAELRDPFVPNAFFGEVVLTTSRAAGGRGTSAREASCVFYSGVAVHAIGTLAGIRHPGQPELQVGLVIAALDDRWSREDDSAVENLHNLLGSAWGLDRMRRRGGVTISLSVREDALRLIEHAEDDRVKLLQARDEFFRRHWSDLAKVPDESYGWVQRKA